MIIPHDSLSAVALRALVEEFVTRDGTDHSSVERRIDSVVRQLREGLVELHYDEVDRSSNVLPMDGGQPPS